MIYLLGLQNISKGYFEAAEMDRASGVKKFSGSRCLFNALNHVQRGVESDRWPEIVRRDQALTGGGRATLPPHFHHDVSSGAFVRMDAGYAAAMGNFMFVLISVLVFMRLVICAGRKWTYERHSKQTVAPLQCRRAWPSRPSVHAVPFYILLLVSLKPETDLSSYWMPPLEPTLKNFANAWAKPIWAGRF